MRPNQPTWLIFPLALALIASAACGTSSKSASTCGAGETLLQNGTQYCVFDTAVVGNRFDCPLAVPNRHHVGTKTVCSGTTELPAGFSLYPDATIELDASVETQTPDISESDALSDVQPSSGEIAASITIENRLDVPVYFDAARPPFAIRQGGTTFSYFPLCPCDRCGSGEICKFPIKLSLAVELPAKSSVTLELPLIEYADLELKPNCSEGFDGAYCSETRPFDGEYQVEISWGLADDVTSQGLAPSDQTKWGLTLWGLTPQNNDWVRLSKRAGTTVTLSPGSSTSFTIAIE